MDSLVRKKVLYLLSNRNLWDENDNIEHIYENQYERIMKVPCNMLFEGIVNTINCTVSDIKTVIIECLQSSGIEVTFVDDDWNNLELISVKVSYSSQEVIKLNTSKNYMCEFFES